MEGMAEDNRGVLLSGFIVLQPLHAIFIASDRGDMIATRFQPPAHGML